MVVQLTGIVLAVGVFLVALLLTGGYLLERTRTGLLLVLGAWAVLGLLLWVLSALRRRSD